MRNNFNVWDGVYNTFQEVPSCGDGYDSDTWIEQSYNKLEMSLKQLNNNEFTNPNIAFNASPLPIIASLLYSSKKPLNILDFGGGMGTSFIELISTLPKSKHLTFTIVDNKRTCEKGKNLFLNDTRIIFRDELPDDENYDIIYMSSTLQYIENWQELLKTMVHKYTPTYFVFKCLPCGDIVKTFATAQNYYTSKIPYWFFKTSDIIKEMEDGNYKLIFKSNFLNNILGKYEDMPQNNFNTKYQVGYAKNLIFKLENKGN